MEHYSVNGLDDNPPFYFCDLADKRDFATHDIYSLWVQGFRVHLCLISRPLTSLARQTQTDTEILPPRPFRLRSRQVCGGKKINRSAIITTFIPARHDAFAWAGVAQAKRIYCLRFVCACLRLKYLIVYRIQRGLTARPFNSFGDYPDFWLQRKSLIPELLNPEPRNGFRLYAV